MRAARAGEVPSRGGCVGVRRATLCMVAAQGLLDAQLFYCKAPTVPRNYWSPGEDELLATGA